MDIKHVIINPLGITLDIAEVEEQNQHVSSSVRNEGGQGGPP